MLHLMGKVYETQAEADSALVYYQQALSVSGEMGDHQTQARELQSMAQVYRNRGQVEEARQALEQVLKLVRDASDRRGEAIILSSLAFLHISVGDSDEGLRLARESQRIFEEIGEKDEAAKVAENIKKVEDMYRGQKQKESEGGK